MTSEKGPSFKNIIVDLGGVMIEGGATTTDVPLVQPVLDSYKLSPEQEAQMRGAIAYQLQMHTVGTSGPEMDQAIIKQFGAPTTPFTFESIFTSDASGYTTKLESVRLIKQFQKAGIRVIFASNTEEYGWPFITRILSDSGLDNQAIISSEVEQMRTELATIESLDKVPVFVSFLMKTRKGGLSTREDGLTFFDLIQKVSSVIPSETLVVDDRQPYVEEPAKKGYQTHHFTAPENFEKFLRS